MFYREAGQFRTSYAQDSQLLPLRQDRVGMAIMLVVAFAVIPFVSNDYWLSAILITAMDIFGLRESLQSAWSIIVGH